MRLAADYHALPGLPYFCLCNLIFGSLPVFMKTFLSAYFQTIYRPRKTFKELAARPQPVKPGFLFIAVPIVLYTLMYVFLTIANGAPSSFAPWLNIPREKYYALNRFLLAPSMILCWFAAASFIQVTCSLLGGTGTFEQTLATSALCISISMWGGLIHDLPMSFLSATGVIHAAQHEIAMNSPTVFRTLLWACYSVYFLSFIILFPTAVRAVHKLSRPKSILIGISAFIIFQVLFLVFNR